MHSGQPQGANPTPRTLRVKRACSECRRKRERCHPSHFEQPPLVPKKIPAPAPKMPSRRALKVAARSTKACNDCRRKKARCNPSHHLLPATSPEPANETSMEPPIMFTVPPSASPQPPLVSSANCSSGSHSPAFSAALQVERATPKAEARVVHRTPSSENGAAVRPSLIINFKYSSADLTDRLKNAQPQSFASPSRAASTAPASAAVAAVAATIPAEAAVNGSPIRAWINEKLTPYLIEGMKTLARDRPEDPMRVLGTYLLACAEKYEPLSNSTKSGSGGDDDGNPANTSKDDDDDMEE